MTSDTVEDIAQGTATEMVRMWRTLFSLKFVFIPSFSEAIPLPVKMKKLGRFSKISLSFFNFSWTLIVCLQNWFVGFLQSFVHVLVARLSPFWIHLSYLIILTLLGYLGLKVSSPKTTSFTLQNIDVFFTSVSAATVSSIATVDMEVFSNTQLVIFTLLMLLGGEIFTSIVGFQLMRYRFIKQHSVTMESSFSNSTTDSVGQIQLRVVNRAQLEDEKPDSNARIATTSCDEDLKNNAIKCLVYVVFSYALLVHVAGFILVFLYLSCVPSARQVLKGKGLNIQLVSAFTTVSTLASCGFVPTNENLQVFKQNSGLLLILIPQILLGSTLYPSCLRFVILIMQTITKRVEFDCLLKNSRDLGYSHLLSGLHSSLLAVTVFGLILVQFVLFCSMEWSSQTMEGLNSYQKLVGSLFQVVSTRHAGENIFDMSLISPAVLVVFVVMMYLPPYTLFLPVTEPKMILQSDTKNRSQRRTFFEILQFSPLSYIVIFVVVICITERDKLREDPFNFSVLNIVFEVISAYGNVGLSTGYSCNRQLERNQLCKDTWFGLAGRWSNTGKLVLILVMFFGRLKKFNARGGKAWKLF